MQKLPAKRMRAENGHSDTIDGTKDFSVFLVKLSFPVMVFKNVDTQFSTIFLILGICIIELPF